MVTVLYRPSVRELAFQLYDYPLHPEWIEGVHARHFMRDGYELTVHLTTSGHFVVWRRGPITLVEALSLQDLLPETRRIFDHRVGMERAEVFRPDASITYQTCFQVEWMTEAVFGHFQDELRSGAGDGVFHQFASTDRMGLSPVSFADIQARPNSLCLHLYHTFPEEGAVVKSQSLIELSH